jgi:hypothetical protein
MGQAVAAQSFIESSLLDPLGAAIQCATVARRSGNGLPHFEQKRALRFGVSAAHRAQIMARVPYFDAATDRNSNAHIASSPTRGGSSARVRTGSDRGLTSIRKRGARRRARTVAQRRSVDRSAPRRSAAPCRNARKAERAFG